MNSNIKVAISAAIVLLVVMACSEDRLIENPPFLTPDNAYNTPADAEQGITGLHAAARDMLVDGARNAMIKTALSTDLSYFGENPSGGEWQDYASNATSTDAVVKVFWDQGYSMIQKANVLIAGIQNSDVSLWESTQYNAAIAEARFFRAYAYRYLVVFFGEIPMVTEVFSEVKTDFTRSPKADIYKLIEEDLIFATTNLPEPGAEAAPGRVNQGAAWHLLSEIYLTQGKYQDAVDAATQVITGYNYALMTSRFGNHLGNDVFGNGDPFYDLFRIGNQNIAENSEAIWVIQIEENVTGGSSFNGERGYGPAYYRMGNTPDGKKAILGKFLNGSYTGYYDTLSRPVAWNRPTNYLAYNIWQSDWDNDIRNNPWNIKRDFYFDNPESTFHGQKIDFDLYPAEANRDPIRDTCQYIFPFFLKIASPMIHFTDPNRSGGGVNHIDRYVFRLAETYLLRAEAYLGLGNNANAAADINVVRNRANATPVDPGDVDIEYILDERARELYTESWRRLTLMRLGLLVERVQQYNNNPVRPGLNIESHNNLLPIPQDQIDLNTGAVFEQNPGY